MFVAPLSKETKFHALSYVWGKPDEKPRIITVNDQPFPVSPNLHEFLEQIWMEQYQHHRKYPTTYDQDNHAMTMWPEPLQWWTDAICINQNDNEEKSTQVPKMGELYSSANRVWIWFGRSEYVFRTHTDAEMIKLAVTPQFLRDLQDHPSVSIDEHLSRSPTEHAPTAFASMIIAQMISDGLTEVLQGREPIKLPDPQVVVESVRAGVSTNEIREAVGLLPNQQGGLSSQAQQKYRSILLRDLLTQLENLINNPWFDRTWIIQEYLLSKNEPIALIGDFSFYLRDLFKLHMFMVLQRETMELTPRLLLLNLMPKFGKLNNFVVASQFLQSVSRNGATLPRLSPGHRLIRFLKLFSKKKSSQKHDHVYGMLGLLQSPLAEELTPDYNLPPERVFQDYATYILKSTGDLKVIETHTNDLKNCPSWVPDFEYLNPDRTLPIPNSVTTGEASFSSDGNELTVKGVRIGEILVCSCRLARATDAAVHLKFIEEEILAGSAAITDRPINDVFLEWLYTLSDTEFELPRRMFSDFACMDDIIAAHLEICRPMPANLVKRLPYFEMNDYTIFHTSPLKNPQLLQAVLSISRLRYCLIETGEILVCVLKGYGEHLNDSVWALKGCQSLSTLQPTHGRYRYAGSCPKYTLGWTHQKAMEHHAAHGIDGPLYAPVLVLNEDYFEGKVLEEVTLV